MTLSQDKSPWLPAKDITGESRFVLVPVLDGRCDTAQKAYWRKGEGFEAYLKPSTKIKPEAYMELPPKYVPEPQPKWDWQDGMASPCDGVGFTIRNDPRFWFEVNMPKLETTSEAAYHNTEREAKLAAEAWWQNLKEIVE